MESHTHSEIRPHFLGDRYRTTRLIYRRHTSLFSSQSGRMTFPRQQPTFTMDIDPLTSFHIPVSKRRKLMAVQPTPPRLSNLLTAFGATRSPISASRTEKGSNTKNLRSSRKVSYAESDGTNSPSAQSDGSTFGELPQSSKTSIELHDTTESEDELHSDDVIHGMLLVISAKEIPLTRRKLRHAQLALASFLNVQLGEPSATPRRRR